MGLLVSSEHCIASPKLAPVASLVSAPALALSFIHTISTTYRFGPCGVVGDALALWLPRSVPAISPSATKTELFRARDRWFESISLQRGVSCEPELRRLSAHARAAEPPSRAADAEALLAVLVDESAASFNQASAQSRAPAAFQRPSP
jgi:hypothetical protein